jgi:L-fuculose-phosphate aldolase
MRKEIVKYMHRLYQTNLTTSLGGNISCRNTELSFYISPSSIDKASLSESDILMINQEGNVVEGFHSPSMEYLMHLYVYKQRPDVNAIIHAHPFYSTLFSASNSSINLSYTSEAYKNIATIGVAKYYTMGTTELANEVSKISKTHNVILMENHGVLTVGKSLLEAFYRLEVLEQAARMTFYSISLPLNELTEANKNQLNKMM